jgi:hypothetical protein
MALRWISDMLFSLAVSWRYACLIAIVIAPAKSGEATWSRKFVSALFVPSFVIGRDDPASN